MKVLTGLAVLGAAIFCPAAWSAACGSATLASYEALGSGGCTIGTNLLSSFATVSGTFGATEIDPSLVTIIPVGGTADPTLIFSVAVGASAGQLLETIFTYQISGNPYLQSTITLTGSSESGDGGVTDIQNLCAGGTFGPDGVTGCTGTPFSLLTLDGVQNTDQTALASPTLVSVTDDFTVDGGLDGQAGGGNFTDQFLAQTTPNPVPEPAATMALGGFALLMGTAYRRFVSKRKK